MTRVLGVDWQVSVGGDDLIGDPAALNASGPLVLDVPNASYINVDHITGDPAVSVQAANVLFINRNGTVDTPDGAASGTAVLVQDLNSRIVNETDGIIRASGTAIVFDGTDGEVVNYGTIIGDSDGVDGGGAIEAVDWPPESGGGPFGSVALINHGNISGDVALGRLGFVMLRDGVVDGDITLGNHLWLQGGQVTGDILRDTDDADGLNIYVDWRTGGSLADIGGTIDLSGTNDGIFFRVGDETSPGAAPDAALERVNYDFAPSDTPFVLDFGGGQAVSDYQVTLKGDRTVVSSTDLSIQTPTFLTPGVVLDTGVVFHNNAHISSNPAFDYDVSIGLGVRWGATLVNEASGLIEGMIGVQFVYVGNQVDETASFTNHGTVRGSGTSSYGGAVDLHSDGPASFVNSATGVVELVDPAEPDHANAVFVRGDSVSFLNLGLVNGRVRIDLVDHPDHGVDPVLQNDGSAVIAGDVQLMRSSNVMLANSGSAQILGNLDIRATDDLTVTNSGSAQIIGGVQIRNSDHVTVVNSGSARIEGAVSWHRSTDVTLTNTGGAVIAGGLATTPPAGSSGPITVTNEAGAQIRGAVDLFSSAWLSFTNQEEAVAAQTVRLGATERLEFRNLSQAAIQGTVYLSEAENMIVENGVGAELAGGISLFTSSTFTDVALSNQGVIGTSAGGWAVSVGWQNTATAAAVDNTGLIYGDVQLSLSADRLTNAGTIAGDVRLNDGDDIYEGAAGSITGAIEGGAGDDSITGGQGVETAVYSGQSGDYDVVIADDGTVTVTDLNTTDDDEGTDTLTSIEFLRFADQTIALSDPGPAPAPAPLVIDGTGQSVVNGEDRVGDPAVLISGDDNSFSNVGASLLTDGTLFATLHVTGSGNQVINDQDGVIDGGTGSAVRVGVGVGGGGGTTVADNTIRNDGSLLSSGGPTVSLFFATANTSVINNGSIENTGNGDGINIFDAVGHNVVNNGHIASSGNLTTGIRDSGDGGTITNNGTIVGHEGISIWGPAATVVNTGEIHTIGSGISAPTTNLSDPDQVIEIRNSGTIISERAGGIAAAPANIYAVNEAEGIIRGPNGLWVGANSRAENLGTIVFDRGSIPDNALPQMDAMRSHGDGSTFINAGTITAAGGSIPRTVTAIFAGDRATVDNSGRIDLADQQSIGVWALGDADVDNSGDILTTRNGITAGPNSTVDNSGRVQSAETTGIGVGGESTVTNSGEIVGSVAGVALGWRDGQVDETVLINTADGTIASDGNAVITRSAQDGITIRVVNAGLIHGDTDGTGGGLAIVSGYNTPTADIVENTGTIIGSIVLDNGDDRLVNAGHIDGFVSLWEGQDVFDGTGGTVTGVVNGGPGDDQITGGAGADDLDGGWDDDVLVGGGGDDLLRGNLGDDQIDGGAGDDTAAFAGVRDRFNVVVADDGTVTVTDMWSNDGDDGTDTLVNVEFLQFNDRTVSVQSLAEETLVIDGADTVVVNTEDRIGAPAVHITGQGTTFTNDGARITGTSPAFFQTGLLIETAGVTINNLADSEIVGVGARAIATSGSAGLVLNNDGLIDTNSSITIAVSQTGTVNNSTSGVLSSAGDVIHFANGGGTVVNNGRITAGTDHAAIRMNDSHSLNVINNSVIEGDVTVREGAGGRWDTVLNRGLIDGDVSLGTFGDVVETHSTIDGDVDLGSGDDTFVLRPGGHVTGTIRGGVGLDTADLEALGGAVWVDLIYAGVEAWTRDGADLTTGAWREIADLDGIENIIGTAFDDLLRGDGSDNVFGHTGGFDILDGRGGSDRVTFDAFGSAVWVDLAYAGAEAWTRDGEDLSTGGWRAIADLVGIENLTGTAFDDQLRGDGADNLFGYIGGRDVLDGRGGTDTASFSDLGRAVWVDLAYRGVEAWTRDGAGLSTGTWREIADLAGIENVIGTIADDQLRGDGGDNVFGYTGGRDLLDGRGGTDTADFSAYHSAVWVDLAYAGVEAWTRFGPDLSTGTWHEIADLAGIENLTGTSFDDLLRGDDGDNTLTGGLGDDTFVFSGGADTVLDFEPGSDLVDLRGLGLDFAQVAANTVQQGGTAVFTDPDSGASIALVGIQAADLDADDFLL